MLVLRFSSVVGGVIFGRLVAGSTIPASIKTALLVAVERVILNRVISAV